LVKETRSPKNSTGIIKRRREIPDARKAIEGENVAAIKAATERLQKASHVIAEHLYKAAQGAPASGGAQSSPDANVKDAEVVDAEELGRQGVLPALRLQPGGKPGLRPDRTTIIYTNTKIIV